MYYRQTHMITNTLFNATLVKVVDGDTLSILVELPLNVYKLETIRLLDINSPERNTVEGKAAKSYVEELIGDKSLVIDTDSITAKRDKYGRLLAHVYLPQLNVSLSEQLVSAGHAVKYVKK